MNNLWQYLQFHSIRTRIINTSTIVSCNEILFRYIFIGLRFVAAGAYWSVILINNYTPLCTHFMDLFRTIVIVNNLAENMFRNHSDMNKIEKWNYNKFIRCHEDLDYDLIVIDHIINQSFSQSVHKLLLWTKYYEFTRKISTNQIMAIRNDITTSSRDACSVIIEQMRKWFGLE